MKTLVRTHILLHKLTLTLVTLSLVLSSCVENSGVKGKTAKSGSNLTSGSGGSGSGAGAIPSDNTSTDTALQSIKVELSHLVDPFDGTYKKKVSIPKNYKGFLYIAGLNVSALQSKLVKVRFNFGLEGQSVTLDATVGRAPGIIPQTDIQVLMVNMNSKPFSKMVLGYDLYDYNDYNTDTSKEPVTDPRDSGLYCRGLKLEDDPTFDNTTASNSTCSLPGDKCLYAYAKVADATLYNTTTGFTSIPSRPQVWSLSSGTRSPTIATSATSMCLPDYGNFSSFNDLFSLSPAITAIGSNDPILGATYHGPYRAINPSGWKIQGNAIFNGTTGLFKTTFPGQTYVGLQSLLFPLAGKIDLNQDVRYLGSTDRFGVRNTLVADSTGRSKYVDGCNLRVMNYNVATTESISSCNVNGSIDIFYMKDNAEVSITTDRSIKLQLLRPSLTNFEGKEVLTSAFKRCESSSTCGSSECCFNERCWSKDLVTQCVDQVPGIGNEPIGNSCVSDFECSSLCCDQSRGACAPHNPNGTAPVSCNKTSGQSCVAKEFCKPEFVETCKLVKLPGLDEQGRAKCTLRCPPVETYGECTAGRCVPPAIPPVPTFDPANPDCRNAVDP
ncbi:hypothetical protein SHI21_08930 [Bacteriovorax sp. PP10]|uniref:Lipoprotein n=1 Tax=Bacteriovorax antarcticus TaxID=3088717 RepID=A0ABU5VVD6_9BACT|nr:hypothetical protein [Bacteriovorax sp. PP10]MEA9356324.1 hypothetical protein [Bacteriovorax sp. PP10]